MTEQAVEQVLDLPVPVGTGERLLTEEHLVWKIEHLHRYGMALALCRDKAVLDIASGEGYGANLLANISKSVVGVDISEEAVSHARAKYKKPNLTFLQASADSIPLDAESLDVVVSFETIEHHDKHEEMMGEIKRVLRPGGLLFLSSPDKLYFSDLPRYHNPFHVKELTLAEFRSLVSGYFTHVEIFLQKFLIGSLVAPEKNVQGFVEFWGDFDTIYSSRRLQEPIYNICMASDGALPAAEVSFFEGLLAFHNTHIRPLQETADQLRESVNQLNQTIEGLQRELDAKESDLQAKECELQATAEELRTTGRDLRDVMNSRSLRLGRLLTWPARKLVRRITPR